jgi:hypothetical protein
MCPAVGCQFNTERPPTHQMLDARNWILDPLAHQIFSAPPERRIQASSTRCHFSHCWSSSFEARVAVGANNAKGGSPYSGATTSTSANNAKGGSSYSVASKNPETPSRSSQGRVRCHLSHCHEGARYSRAKMTMRQVAPMSSKPFLVASRARSLVSCRRIPPWRFRSSASSSPAPAPT